MEKNVAVAILGPEEPEGDEYDAVCSEIMSAFEKKDTKMLNKALGAYFDMKGTEPDGDDLGDH